MRIDNINNQQKFGNKVPTIFSKNKMQTAIESVTRINRNSELSNSTWCYNDEAGYVLILFKYLATRIQKAFQK